MSSQIGPESGGETIDWEQILAGEGLGSELPAEEAIAVGDDIDLDRDARADRAHQAMLDQQSDKLWQAGDSQEEQN